MIADLQGFACLALVEATGWHGSSIHFDDPWM